LAGVCHPRAMTPGTRAAVALIASFVVYRISLAIIDTYLGAAFLGLIVGLGIIFAVPAKKKASKG
jgi:hypothetical protein